MRLRTPKGNLPIVSAMKGGEIVRDFSKGILIPILVLLVMIGIAVTDETVAQAVTEINVVTMIEP